MESQTQTSFPLLYQFQNYDWGKLGSQSLVYSLSQKSGVDLEGKHDKPFAELWMGGHDPIPSSLKKEDGSTISLQDLIKSHPEKVLGKAYEQFGQKKKLPFLFKVLSVRKTLSLQVHPTKELAQELHKKNPEVYKDATHKPEIAIALSEFEAMCNFRPYEEIVKDFESIDALRDFIGNDIVKNFAGCEESQRKDRLRDIFKEFFKKDEAFVKETIKRLTEQLSQKGEKTSRDKLVLKLQEQYPNDIGVLMSYLLNYITVQPGDAFVMDPCEPHAYVHGDCIEASDNVIRGCLTPKFIDKETLCEALSYDMKSTSVSKGEPLYTEEKDGFEVVKYPTRYEEFCCYKVRMNNKNQKMKDLKFDHPSITIIVKGSGRLNVKSEGGSETKSYDVKEGQSYFFLPGSHIAFETLEVGGLEAYFGVSQTL